LKSFGAVGLLTQKTGSVADGTKRGPLNLIGNDLTFVINTTIEDFAIWTETGSAIVNTINNVFGSGDDNYGANDGIQTLNDTESPYTYTSTYTVTETPSNWQAPGTPTWAAPSTGYGSKFEIWPTMRKSSNGPAASTPIPVYEPAPLWRPGSVDYELHYWGSF
jgi:hypothetical protein